MKSLLVTDSELIVAKGEVYNHIMLFVGGIIGSFGLTEFQSI